MRLKIGLAAIAVAGLLLVTSGVGAQDKKVRLQVGGAFPSTTGLLGPTQQYFVDTLRKVSGGSIDAKFFEPGALVPASQYFDAVANGSLDSAWTVSGSSRARTSPLPCTPPCPSGRKQASTWAG